MSWTREGRIFMFNDQKRKKSLGVTLKCLTAAAALGIALTAVSPTTSAFAKSEEKSKFEFGIVPDVQYWGGDSSGTRYYRNSVDKLIKAAQTLNSEDVEFTVQTGDLIDRDLSSFSTILPIYNMIEGPKYHVLGNHDFPVTTDQVIDILDMPNQYYDFKYKNWEKQGDGSLVSPSYTFHFT